MNLFNFPRAEILERNWEKPSRGGGFPGSWVPKLEGESMKQDVPMMVMGISISCNAKSERSPDAKKSLTLILSVVAVANERERRGRSSGRTLSISNFTLFIRCAHRRQGTSLQVETMTTTNLRLYWGTPRSKFSLFHLCLARVLDAILPHKDIG